MTSVRGLRGAVMPIPRVGMGATTRRDRSHLRTSKTRAKLVALIE